MDKREGNGTEIELKTLEEERFREIQWGFEEESEREREREHKRKVLHKEESVVANLDFRIEGSKNPAYIPRRGAYPLSWIRSFSKLPLEFECPNKPFL